MFFVFKLIHINTRRVYGKHFYCVIMEILVIRYNWKNTEILEFDFGSHLLSLNYILILKAQILKTRVDGWKIYSTVCEKKICKCIFMGRQNTEAGLENSIIWFVHQILRWSTIFVSRSTACPSYSDPVLLFALCSWSTKIYFCPSVVFFLSWWTRYPATKKLFSSLYRLSLWFEIG